MIFGNLKKTLTFSHPKKNLLEENIEGRIAVGNQAKRGF
jgi:hypothetical protein